MSSVEERMKILKMIEEGKISAEEGAKLLSRRPSGLRKTIADGNSLAHRTTWLRSDLREWRACAGIHRLGGENVER